MLEEHQNCAISKCTKTSNLSIPQQYLHWYKCFSTETSRTYSRSHKCEIVCIHCNNNTIISIARREFNDKGERKFNLFFVTVCSASHSSTRKANKRN